MKNTKQSISTIPLQRPQLSSWSRNRYQLLASLIVGFSLLETACIQVGGSAPDWMPESSSSSETTDVETSTGDLPTTEGTTDSPTGGSNSASEGSGETTTDSDTGSLCGNAVLDQGEDCDDGNQSNEDACLVGCIDAKCGDGYVHEGLEDCDEGTESATCNADCSLVKCGDGYVNAVAGEECDDGNDKDNDNCTTECTTAVCGDGYKQPLEECDDGNEVNTDFCTNECEVAKCGDKYKQPGEECDDGNTSNTDGCTNVCKQAKCGDGYIQPGEQCDDANQLNTDNCTNDCKLPVCGDSFVQLGEECDDGNPKNYDGCSTSCKREGIVFVTSQTFSGNLDDLDGADAKCQAAAMAAGLTGQFKAWLGTNVYWPTKDFIAYEGTYRRRDGLLVANSWADLVDGTLINPIQYDEYGVKINSGNVWTNVDFDGEWASDNSCQGWTNSLNVVDKPYYGNLTSKAVSWTKNGNDKGCSTKLHLYCFAQGGD